MRKLIGVYGAAGCGRGVMPLLRVQYPNVEFVFIDDMKAPGEVNGSGIVAWSEFVKRTDIEKNVSIAIANPKIRQRIAEKLTGTEMRLIEARSTSVVQMDDVIIGEGACLSPYVVLTSNIRIGRCFHANISSYIEHDCVIGDFVTIAPGAKVNGNVRIGDHVYIGSGAIIRQGITIGAGAIVGMGAVVTKDVAAGTTVFGNPAKLSIKD